MSVLDPVDASRPRAAREPRRAHRDTSNSLLGGVAAGLADHLGVPVLAVRAFFIVATALSGLGIGLYAAFWVMLPARTDAAETAGAESLGRLGMRPKPLRRVVDLGPTLALMAFGAGAILLLAPTFGVPAHVLWPLMVAVAGVALLWRQADEAQRARLTDPIGRMSVVRLVFGGGGWGAYARVGAGLLLVLLGLLTLSLQQVRWSDVRTLTLAFVFALAGVTLVVGPWVSKLVSDLASERAERVRSQERADVAAHLHDSVLQTLAMIQRSAGDPETVAQLARSQERDLRNWLYEPDLEGTIAGAIRQAAAEVEDAHRVQVDAVVVGDGPLTEAAAIVAAAREAMANAARHSGGSEVSVYVEITDEAVEVFVRDRGRGFDVEAIPSDRHGVRDSILDRMDRHGGSAEILSNPGEGTEVRLRQPRGAV